MKERALLIFTIFFLINFFSGQIKQNTCDKNFLNEKELRKCKMDSIYIEDFTPRINLVIDITTKLLPKYRKLRDSVKIDKNLLNNLQKLKSIYDSVLVRKLDISQKDVYKNGLYVSPKSYLSTTIAMQSFRIYPDVFAILCNQNNLVVNPVTSEEDFREYEQRINEIIAIIPTKQKNEISKIAEDLRKEKEKIPNNEIEILQGRGLLNSEQRNNYDIVDFLLWNL